MIAGHFVFLSGILFIATLLFVTIDVLEEEQQEAEIIEDGAGQQIGVLRGGRLSSSSSSSSSNIFYRNHISSTSAMATAALDNNNSKKSPAADAILLPKPMSLLRRNVPLSTYYNYDDNAETIVYKPTDKCSCYNPQATRECCRRDLFRSHKMGTVLTKTLFQQPYGVEAKNKPDLFNYTSTIPLAPDFRDVLMFRNIYDSIVSGYLFHSSGQECNRKGKYWKYLKRWEQHLSYDLADDSDHNNGAAAPAPGNGRNICQYLNEESKPIGMRAYIDWVFRYYYGGILSHYALSKEIPSLQGRIKTVCYENLMSADADSVTINSMLEFWYNGTSNYVPFNQTKLPGHQGTYSGKHATTKDQELRTQLHDLIKSIDKQYYNGEIEWLHNSILPC